EDRAARLVQRPHELADLRAEHALHRPLLRSDDVDLEAPRAQRGRDLEADEARTDDDGAPCLGRALDDRAAVPERAQHEHVRLIRTRHGQAHRLRSSREQQPVVTHAAAVAEADFARARIDLRDGGSEAKVDAVLLVEARGAQRQPFFRSRAGEIVLREIRTIDRERIVVAEHHEAALVTLAPKPLGCGESCRPAADDDDAIRLPGRSCARRPLRPGALLAHEDFPIALLHRPARERAERGGAERLARAQIEARMMPRAPHGVVDDQAFAEGTVIVRAERTDGEDLVAAADDQHLVVADAADQLAAVGKRIARNTGREIRSAIALFRHEQPPDAATEEPFSLPLPAGITTDKYRRERSAGPMPPRKSGGGPRSRHARCVQTPSTMRYSGSEDRCGPCTYGGSTVSRSRRCASAAASCSSMCCVRRNTSIVRPRKAYGRPSPGRSLARSTSIGSASAWALALGSKLRTNGIAARNEANDARPATETPRNPLLFTAASFPPLAGGRIMPHEADERVRLGSANRRAGSRRP